MARTHRLNVVNVPSIAKPIQPSPGFSKKGLSDFKLDVCGLCEFGCRYCSSNHGNYLRINRGKFARLTEEQLGRSALPAEEPNLMFRWPEVLDRLKAQLHRKKRSWGWGKTLVYSMLTDGFSPSLVRDGVTEAALRGVLEQTSFRVRVLTKNAIVGTDYWVEFFRGFSGRFVVGLSVGTGDDRWARRVEVGTSQPSARLRALHRLQDAGVPTYGMLCPVFPDLLAGDALERLVDRVKPDSCEHVWAEPFNDRLNWRQVRDGYDPGSPGYRWLTDVYDYGKRELWSRYATELYKRLRDKSEREGWLSKLRYLLYEDQITSADALAFAGLKGVWLQSKPGPDGRSQNPAIAALQGGNVAVA